MSLKEALALLVMVTLIGTTALFWRPGADGNGDGDGGQPAPAEPAATREADLVMEDALITEFEADGALRYRIHADQVRHFNDQELTRLTAPRLEYSVDPDPRWHVTASHGYVRSRLVDRETRETIFLREDVELLQRYPDGRYVRIRTPALYVYPDEQLADTDQGVIIDTSAGRSKASMLRANLAANRLRLNANAGERVKMIVLPDQMK